MEGTHEVGWRPFMPASTLSGRSVALLRVRLDDCTPSEGQLISHGNCARSQCVPTSSGRRCAYPPWIELQPRSSVALDCSCFFPFSSVRLSPGWWGRSHCRAAALLRWSYYLFLFLSPSGYRSTPFTASCAT